MKNLITLFAVITAMATSDAAAAEPYGNSTQNGMISASQLSEMGLGGMTIIPDSQAQEIRGQGFVVVFGRSYAGRRSDSYFKVRRNFAYGSSSSSSRRSYAGGWSVGFAW